MTRSNVIPLPTQSRQWSAAKFSAENPDWTAYSRPVDSDIRHGLSAIRARSRDLAQNSDHAKGFVRMVRNNIVGAPGFVLQSRAVTARGKPDQAMRQQYEDEWRQWGRRGNCEVSGKFSWRSLQRHCAESLARDGEFFIRIVSPWDTRWGIALELIDPEAVDIGYNGEYQGRQVRMGVEIDDYRRPVAYHIYGEPPINNSSYRYGTDRFRIPAEQIVHGYLPEFTWQTRGVPWLAVAAGRLHMITGTEDAEVTASRASAAKFAAYEAAEWAPPPPRMTTDSGSALVDAWGNPISADPGRFAQDLAPGTMEVVPYGYKLSMLDPQHPNTAMPDFLKWALRSVGTGLGVSYNALGNNAEGVNYTSLRYFLGLEHDNWMELQDQFQDDLPEPVRQVWTATQIAMGTLQARPGRESQWNNIYWQARRWEGPDPAKQSQADKQELEIGSTTLTAILARKGLDFEDVLAERVEELRRIKEVADKAGVSMAEILPYLISSGQGQAQAQMPSDNGADPNA